MAKSTTTTRKTTTTTKTSTAAAASETEVQGVTAEAETDAAPVVVFSGLKKKDLIEKAAARSGVKKQYAKSSIEAALAILGEAIDDGDDLSIEPFGKLKIMRDKEVPGGKVFNLRLRRKDASQDQGEETSETEGETADA